VSKALPAESVHPVNGDLSFCMECGELAIFDDEFPDGVRKPTPTENSQFNADPVVIKIRLAWLVTIKGRRKH
jgi:hypothetical protein